MATCGLSRQCPPGYASGSWGASDVSECSQCPAGQHSSYNSTVCAQCPAGRYGAVAGLTTDNCSGPCVAVEGSVCAPGAVAPNGVLCPAGFYQAGSGSLSNCTLCPPGEHLSSDHPAPTCKAVARRAAVESWRAWLGVATHPPPPHTTHHPHHPRPNPAHQFITPPAKPTPYHQGASA